MEDIVDLRENAGISQHKLSSMSLVTQQNISDIFSGKHRNFTTVTLNRLLGVFGISLPDIIHEAVEQKLEEMKA